MRYTEYSSAAEFSAAVLPALKRFEIQNNLFFRNICDGPGKTMAAVLDSSGDPLLVAVRTLPFPMLMFEADNVRRDEAVEVLAREFAARGAEVGQFMTEPALAQSFARFYGEKTGKRHQIHENLILYVTDQAPQPQPADGHLRRADEFDLYFMPYWHADFCVACGFGGYNLDFSIEKIKQQLSAGTAFIWEDSAPCSMAATVREVTGCKILGQVYTPPSLRGRGYAGACVGALTRKLLEGGDTHVALYADAANPCSNAVYRRLGYREVFRYDQYREV